MIGTDKIEFNHEKVSDRILSYQEQKNTVAVVKSLKNKMARSYTAQNTEYFIGSILLYLQESHGCFGRIAYRIFLNAENVFVTRTKNQGHVPKTIDNQRH